MLAVARFCGLHATVSSVLRPLLAPLASVVPQSELFMVLILSLLAGSLQAALLATVGHGLRHHLQPSFRDKSAATSACRISSRRNARQVPFHSAPWRARPAPCPSIAPLEGDNIGHDVSDLVSGQRDARHGRMWNDDLSREIFCRRPWPSSDSREAWNIRPHRTRCRTIDYVASDTEPRGKLTSALRVAMTRLRKGRSRNNGRAQSCSGYGRECCRSHR